MAGVALEGVELLTEALLGGLVEEEAVVAGVETVGEATAETVVEATTETAVEATEETVVEATEETVVEATEEEVAGEESLGARIGAALGAKIQTALTKMLGLVKSLTKQTLNLVMLQMAIDELPEKYKKKLAEMIQKLADAAKKLLKTSDKYVELSGGSEEGKKLAKETRGIVDHLHEHVRKLTKDSPPSKKRLTKEKEESMMEAASKQAELNEKKLHQMTGILGELDDVLDEDGEINTPEGESRVETPASYIEGMMPSRVHKSNK